MPEKGRVGRIAKTPEINCISDDFRHSPILQTQWESPNYNQFRGFSATTNYVAKAEKKGRTRAEVDQIISWLTGYDQKELQTQLEQQTDFE
ncbi:MAG: DUF2200 family protein, partial [Phyllobacterium sp.]|uniref:DUF2200 family protein n=1 Tax=Phyllobacterium sp. TaxID=1871046 RepID=UPI0030F0EF37